MGSARTPARLAAAMVVATFALLVFGSTVRAHGAGLACPDWPLCFGEVVPPIDFGVFLEFGHRVLAGLVSVAYLALGVLVFRNGLPGRVKALWGVGFALLGAQVVLGGLTVLELLAEWTVVGHLVTGNAFCLTLLLLALSARELHSPVDRAPVTIANRAWAGRLAVLVFAQLALGGLVSSSHAGLACGTWPSCNGAAWFPTVQGLVGLQVLHRITAYLVLAGALAVVVSTRLRGRTGRAAGVILALVVAQVALGVANVLLLIPVELTVAHAGGAAAIVLATTWLNWEAWRAPVAVSEPADVPVPQGAK